MKYMKKTSKLLSIFLSVFVMISALCIYATGINAEAQGKREITSDGVYWYSDTKTTGYTSGSGTSSDPYIITTAAQLRLAVKGSTKSNIYYKLGNDIAINNTSSSNWYKGTNLKNWIKGSEDGTEFTDAQNKLEMSGDQFRNTFDGDGHTVSGLYIDYVGTGIAGGSYYGWGLFPYVNGATIKNLKLKDVYIRSTVTDDADTKRHGYGALIGSAYTKGATVSNILIENVAFDLTRSALKQSGTTASVNVGAILGFTGGRITVSDVIVKNVKAAFSGVYSSAKQPCRVGSIIGFVLQRFTLSDIISFSDMNPFSNGEDADSVTSANPPDRFDVPSNSSASNICAVGDVSVLKALSNYITAFSDQKAFEINQGDFISSLKTPDLWLPLAKCRLPILKSFSSDQTTVHREAVAATCTKASKCSYCGEYLTTEPDSKNHTGVLVTKHMTPFTCDMIGYEGTVYCSDCGNPVSFGQSLDAIGHNYGEWTVIKPASEQNEGLRKRTCKTCGYVDEDIIPVIVKEPQNPDTGKSKSSKSGRNYRNKTVSSDKIADETDDIGTVVANDGDEEGKTVIREIKANKSDNNIWLFVIILGSLVVAATVLSAFFILKKKKPANPGNKT